jgi:hypothetical protein
LRQFGLMSALAAMRLVAAMENRSPSPGGIA